MYVYQICSVCVISIKVNKTAWMIGARVNIRYYGGGNV